MRLLPVPFGSRQLKFQKPFMRGTDVRRLQQTLKRLGFFYSNIDGVYGNDTIKSVKKFQKYFKLTISGVAGKKEFDILKNLESRNAYKWSAIRKDERNSGYFPVPISDKLKTSWSRPFPNVFGINCWGGRLILSSKEKIWVADYIKGTKIHVLKDLQPIDLPTVSDGMAIIPAGSLKFLDIYSGKCIEIVDEDIFRCSPAVKNGRIYTSSGGSLYAFDSKGHLMWTYKTEGAYCTIPAFGYELIYFASYDGKIYCIDEDGILYWRVKSPGIVNHPPSIWQDMVFFITENSYICALNPLTGKIIWKVRFSEEELMMPAFHDDFMLLANGSGKLTAISFQTYRKKWELNLPAAFTTAPIVCPNAVIIGTEKGFAICNIETLDYNMYFEGNKISSIALSGTDVFIATENKVIRLSPQN